MTVGPPAAAGPASPRVDAPWFVRLRGHPQAAWRLICFPFAGGTATTFQRWPGGLPEAVEVWAAQLPGRIPRIGETPMTHLPALLEALLPAILPLLDRPVAFFGHSLGALLAFELARSLRRMGQPGPLHLFASACRAPQMPNRYPQVHALPEPEFLTALRDFGGTPAAVFEHAELLQLLLPALRADFALWETYTYAAEPPLALSITAFGGLLDERVCAAELEGWRAHTSARFELRLLPGDHFFLQSQAAQVWAAVTEKMGPDSPRPGKPAPAPPA